MSNWVVAGHWLGDPTVRVQQIYGPFDSEELAARWIKQYQTQDPSWAFEAFCLLRPEFRLQCVVG
jgi:hypothetical protein